MGKLLNDVEGITVASSQAGRLPYFSGAKHIDILGLNNKFVAHNRYNNDDFEKSFAKYISRKKPDIYMGYRKKDYTNITDNLVGKSYKKICTGKYEVMLLKDSSKREKLEGIMGDLKGCE
jgi:hypothetical protein